MFQHRSMIALSPLLALSTTAAVAGPTAHSHGPYHAHLDIAAFGREGDPAKPARIVEVRMRESDGGMLFSPDSIITAAGEQIHFVITNEGVLEHEFVIGTVAENRKHAEAMVAFPGMEHDDPNARRLDARQSSELLWQFTNAGTFEFACLIPGHLEAGMRGTIVVR